MKATSILISYEDDLWSRSLVAFFHSLGYRVDTTKMMSEMIRRIRKEDIKVVLIDEEFDGLKACEVVPLLKKINPKIQIVVISSDGSIGSVRRLRGAGIFYQAMKPIDLEEIRSAVECAFGKVERENPKPRLFFFPTPEMASTG